MSTDEKRISLKIDIKSGTIEIDAPVDNFDQAIEKTKELTDSLDLGSAGRSHQPQQRSEAVASETSASNTDGARAKPKTSKATASTARSGRIGSFEPLRDLLNEEQQKHIRDFVSKKSPKEQGDEVLVAMYEGEKLLGRQGFSYNEIYTLMWRAGIDPLPKALDVVLQRLMSEQLAEKSGDGYFLKFLGQSRVEKDLPSSQGAEA